MFKRFYEDELEFLRGMGSEFAAAYPDIAAELGWGARDPDVERLLEGFAFLTARIRENMEADFPQMLLPLMAHHWPHALRPTPAACIVEFKPQPGMFKEPYRLKRHTRLESKPVDGTVCRFQTCNDLDILPVTLRSVQISAPTTTRTRIRLLLEPFPGVSLRKLTRTPIRFYLHGTVRQTFELYLSLMRRLEAVRVRVLGPQDALLAERSFPPDFLTPVGWHENEALLPYPPRSFRGHRHLHEFFLFREKHLFMELGQLELLSGISDARTLEIWFELKAQDEDSALAISTDNLRLHCVPAVNLFVHPARPIRTEVTRSEFLVTAESLPSGHYDIFSIDQVTGYDLKLQKSLEYKPFYSFHRFDPKEARCPLYHVRIRPSVGRQVGDEAGIDTHPGVDTYLSFVGLPDTQGQASSLVSVDLTLTNRDLPRRLKPGDVSVPTSDVPALLTFTNIGPFSVPCPALMDREGLWRYFAQMSLTWDCLSDRDALCGLLSLYHFPAMVDHRARQSLERLQGAIVSVRSVPERRPVGHPPAVVYGTAVQIEIREDRFAHIGELHLFGSALMCFLVSISPLNTFVTLNLKGVDHGQEFRWSPRVGQQHLI